MTTKLSFSVPGEPKGKGRARAFASIVQGADGEPRAVVRMVTPSDTVAAEKAVRAIFMRKFPHHAPWTGAVLIRFTAVFETPKSFNRALTAAANEGRLHCIKKPDKDNIEKLIVDALNGIAWHDDAQFMGGGIKRYGSPARVDVTLELMETGDTPATPGQKRIEARVAAGEPVSPKRGRRGNQTKSRSKFPASVQRAIDAALEREGLTVPAQRGLFGDKT